MEKRYSFVPIEVQHCNPRTEYRMVRHVFDPIGCAECALIVDGLIGRDWKIEDGRA